MNKFSIALLGILFSTTAMADVTLSNKDSREYQLLLDTSDSCFSGLHTYVSSYTTRKAPEGWACLNKQKPAVKLEKGKDYMIKNGKIQPQ